MTYPSLFEQQQQQLKQQQQQQEEEDVNSTLLYYAYAIKFNRELQSAQTDDEGLRLYSFCILSAIKLYVPEFVIDRKESLETNVKLIPMCAVMLNKSDIEHVLHFHNFFVTGLAREKEWEMRVEQIMSSRQVVVDNNNVSSKKNKNRIKDSAHMLVLPVLTPLESISDIMSLMKPTDDTYFNHLDNHKGLIEHPISFQEFEKRIKLDIMYIKTYGDSLLTLIENEMDHYRDIFPGGTEQIRNIFRRQQYRADVNKLIETDEELKKAIEVVEIISEKFSSSVVLTAYNFIPYNIESIDLYSHIDDPMSKDSPTYNDYYTNKRKLEIKYKDQPLLRASFTHERAVNEKRKWDEMNTTAVKYFLQRAYDELPKQEGDDSSEVIPTKNYGVVLLSEFCSFSHLPDTVMSYTRYIISVLKYVKAVNEHYELLQNFETGIKYHFQNKILLRQALTHKTYCSENEIAMTSNERLEFLGDSVLEIIVSHFLFEKFRVASEGQLTFLRTQMVKNKFLQAVANRMNILDYLLFPVRQRQIVEDALKVGADTLEAIVGAIFLDGGLIAAKEFCTDFIIREIQHELENRPDYEAHEIHSFEIPYVCHLKLDEKQQQLISELENTVGVKFNNPFIALQALTHVSWGSSDTFEFRDKSYVFNYERLEFLGDCVLKFIVGSWLFLNYPYATESKMTLARHCTVDNMVSLAGAGEKLGLGRFIRYRMPLHMMRPGTQHFKNAVSDVFEALLGAIYLDQGGLYLINSMLNNGREYDVYGEFVHKYLISDRKEIVNPYNVTAPFKNTLQELVQVMLPGKFLPDYKLLESIQREGVSYVKVAVYVMDITLAIGGGDNKKEAENDAAQKALELCQKIQLEEIARLTEEYQLDDTSNNIKNEESGGRISHARFKELVHQHSREMQHLFSTSFEEFKRLDLDQYDVVFELRDTDNDIQITDYEDEEQMLMKLRATLAKEVETQTSSAENMY